MYNRADSTLPKTIKLDILQQNQRRADLRLIGNLLLIMVFIRLSCAILHVPLLNLAKLENNFFLHFWMEQHSTTSVDSEYKSQNPAARL